MRAMVYRHQQHLSYFLLLLIIWFAPTSVWSSDHRIDSVNITVVGFPSIAKTNPKLSKDNMTDNYSKETNPQLTSSKSKPAPQYKIETHTFVAAIAKNILPNSDMKTEITSYLGTLIGDCSSPDIGSSILDGVWEEDCTWHPLLHFWDPDTNVGLFDQKSAYERAQGLWTDALAIYSVGIEARGRAYYLLGRVAHLLEDMAQPAHVHLDAHHPVLESDDNYEALVNDMRSDYISSEPRTGMGSDIVSFLKGYPLTPIQYYDLPSNLSGGSYDYSQSGYLSWLFLNLAETADFFESEDVKGDSDRIQFDRIGNEEITWHADGTLPPDSSPEFTVEHARIHADTLIPLAERYVAGLYQLFWDRTHPVRIDDVSLAASLGCNGFDNREWVDIQGQWFDNYSTVILNDGTSSYTIPESRVELISSTIIRVCAGVRYTPNWTAVVENNPANVSNVYNFFVSIPKLPSVSIYANPSSINLGGSSTLTWTSANTTACEASGGWQGPKGTSNSELVSPTSTTTYTLTCTGAGGSDVDSTSVTVGTGSILPPVDVSASDGTYSTGILVDWSDTSGAASYKVYRATSLNGTKAQMPFSGSISIFADTNFVLERKYWYWVKACDSTEHCSDYSNPDTGYASESISSSLSPPVNPDPADGETEVSIKTDLCWSNGGGATRYDVYFGTDTTPNTLVCKDVTTASCNPSGDFAYSTHYYWYVIAQDRNGATRTGSTWDFTTTSEPETIPTLDTRSTIIFILLLGISAWWSIRLKFH